MKFNFKAKNGQGEIKSGEIEAADSNMALQILQKSSLFPISLIQQKEVHSSLIKTLTKMYESVSSKELVIFFRQLAILIEARVPVVESLSAIEEQTINNLIKKGSKNIHIVIYGKNTSDDTIYKKYQQLIKIGFYNISVYPGGMFEWLMLQDIYGPKEFPTTKKELDILKYKPSKVLNVQLLEYHL